MAFQISRLYDFQPGTKILSSQVDAEFNQLITSHNNLDAATDTYKALLLSSTGSTNIGITPVAGLDVSVNTLQKFILAEVTARLAHTDNISNPHGVTKAQVGLSNADNTSDLNKPVSTAQLAALNDKVDKVTGKGLSTEDYTTTEKTKLAGIATGANNYTHPATHSADMVIDGTTNKVYTAEEKTKLAGIAAGVSVDLSTHMADKIAHIPMVTATGTANTYAVTIPGVTAYTDDLIFWVKIPASNTGSSTINVNNLGVKIINTTSGYSLPSGAIVAGQSYLIHCRSSLNKFFILSRMCNDVDTKTTQTLENKTLNFPNINTPTMYSPRVYGINPGDLDSERILLYDDSSYDVKYIDNVALKYYFKNYFDALYAAIIHTHNADAITDGTTNKVFTATEKTKLSGIAENANNYTHPATHSISEVSGLQAALDGKVDDSQVLTNVPTGAIFTDTVTTINGKTGAIAKADITALGIPAQDTVYTHPATHSADMVIDGTINKAYTAIEKNKLAGIAVGAEVNVNADWNAASGDAQILNKPTLATVATSGSYEDLSNKPSIPSASSAVSATLVATSWTGTNAPYTQTVTISGMTASKNGLIGLDQTATAAEREAARNAILSITQQGTDTITITADGEKPTITIPIAVALLG